MIRLGSFITTNANELTMFANHPLHIAITPNAPLDAVIIFQEEYVDIFIEKSKTDCNRNGKNVLIAKLNTPQCPVTILQCYIREAKLDLSTDKYIFRPLIYFKRNKNYMMRNRNIKLSYTRAREIIREALSSNGINMNKYGLHSLRSGAQALGSSIFISSILSIKCASTTYMNPFDIRRCEINAFMNYAQFA